MSAPRIIHRDEWLALRKLSIGSSEAAAAVGEDEYSGPYRLWCEKTGKLAPEDISEKRAVRLGRKLQPIVVEEYAHERGVKIVTDCAEVEALLQADGGCEVLGWVEGLEPFVRSTRYPWMTATLDAVVRTEAGGIELVEAKAPGHRQLWKWGEDGTAPDSYKLQTAHALIVVSAVKVGVLVALIGGSDYREVRLDSEHIPEKALLALERQFMDCVESNTPPQVDGSPATAAAIKALHPRDNGESIALPGTALYIHEELQALSKAREDTDKREEELRTMLKALIGPSTFGVLPAGKGMYSFRTQERDGYTVAASEFRQLRFLKAKG